MPISIVVPQLGESVVEGTISKWLKNVGDPVKEEEPLVEIMTDKITIEVPSPGTGTLGKILVESGTVPIGEKIAILLAAGETLADVAAPAAASAKIAAPVASVGASAPRRACAVGRAGDGSRARGAHGAERTAPRGPARAGRRQRTHALLARRASPRQGARGRPRVGEGLGPRRPRDARRHDRLRRRPQGREGRSARRGWRRRARRPAARRADGGDDRDRRHPQGHRRAHGEEQVHGGAHDDVRGGRHVGHRARAQRAQGPAREGGRQAHRTRRSSSRRRRSRCATSRP